MLQALMEREVVAAFDHAAELGEIKLVVQNQLAPYRAGQPHYARWGIHENTGKFLGFCVIFSGCEKKGQRKG